MTDHASRILDAALQLPDVIGRLGMRVRFMPDATADADRAADSYAAAERFPCSPIDVVEPNEVLILAVAHQRQRADDWRDRRE